ncbi:unnamed protein product, partial [Sphagnum compactum]
MALIRQRSFAPFRLQLQMQVLCHYLQTQLCFDSPSPANAAAALDAPSPANANA